VLAIFSITASARERAAPAKSTGKGLFAEPQNSKGVTGSAPALDVGREVLIPLYILAQFAENGALKSCQLKSSTVSYLGAENGFAILQIKTSGNIAYAGNEACKSDDKVAMTLDRFLDIVRAADSTARREKEAENTQRSLLDFLKK
jgi:hypothetical protein